MDPSNVFVTKTGSGLILDERAYGRQCTTEFERDNILGFVDTIGAVQKWTIDNDPLLSGLINIINESTLGKKDKIRHIENAKVIPSRQILINMYHGLNLLGPLQQSNYLQRITDEWNGVKKGNKDYYSDDGDDSQDEDNIVKDKIPQIKFSRSKISSKGKIPLIGDSKLDYDPYDEDFYFDDYLDLTQTKYVFNDIEEATTYALFHLRRVVKYISIGNITYFFKSSKKTPFSIGSTSNSVAYDDLRFKYKQKLDKKCKEGEKGDIVVGSLPCMLLFKKHNRELGSREITWEPYHRDQANRDGRIFNVFDGFVARLVPDFGDKEFEEVKTSILDHMLNIYAKGNVEYLKYILTWFAHPIRTLTRTSKVLVLTGKPGCGKSIILEFFDKYVYGPNLAYNSVGIDKLTQRFNSIVSCKILICINEMASVSQQKDYKSKFETLKDLVTSPILGMEKKGLEPERIHNHCNFVIASNNPNPVYLGEGDRRYAIFACSDVLKPLDYFSTLAKKINNQRMGDLIYTFFRSKYMDEYLVSLDNIPMTEAKMQNIEISEPKINTFVKMLTSKQEPIDIKNMFLRNGKPFISTEALFGMYSSWSARFFPGSIIGYIRSFSIDLKRQLGGISPGEHKLNGPKRCGYYFNETLWDKIVIIIHSVPPKVIMITDWMKNPSNV